MAGPGRTQKQIAERYKGNLGYYNKKHPWRRARFWVSWFAIFGGIAAIAAYHKRGPEKFFTAGKISSTHAAFGDDCAKCHAAALTTPAAKPAARFPALTKDRFRHGIDFAAIDRKCETCHQQHTLHEPNVVQDRSCSACHQEHKGAVPLGEVASSQCASCHNNGGTMEASAQKGTTIAPAAFHLRALAPGQVVFNLPRPARGYTQVFSSFAAGHPEFQLTYDKPRDPDTLRFNHQRHLAGTDIPLVSGRKLDCAYCHKADPDGRYYQRISFAANCQSCHSLQIDPRNPELVLPHGNVPAVRGFLRALPAQYADLAAKKGLVRPADVQAFVTRQIVQLREQVRSGEELERQVFFTANPYRSERGAAPGTRASFYGCAFCHEVKAGANSTPEIAKPVAVDRWMPQARFDHAKHASVSCDECHHAKASRESSDILMPGKADCVTCHSPQGKVAAECITCHRYHAPPQNVSAPARAANNDVREMLLGANAR